MNWFAINISFRERRWTANWKRDSMEEGGKEDRKGKEDEEEGKPEVRLI